MAIPADYIYRQGWYWNRNGNGPYCWNGSTMVQHGFGVSAQATAQLVGKNLFNADETGPATQTAGPDFWAPFYAGRFSEAVAFSRASTATYVDSTGVLRTALVNAPRITHDPATLQCLGYLHEAQTTNLLTYSQDFSNSAWNAIAANSAVTADAGVAPDGSVTGDLVEMSAASAYRYQDVAPGAGISGQTWTFSLWVWSPTKVNIGVRVANASDGADSTSSTIALSPTPTRVQVTRTFSSAGTNILVGLENRIGDGGDGVAGDVYVWGAQLEQNPSATSYIPTTSAAVVRAADIAYIDVATYLTGLDPEDCTFYVEAQELLAVQYARFLNWSGGGWTPLSARGSSILVGLFDGATETIVTGENYLVAPRKMAASLRSGAVSVASSGTRQDGATNAFPTPTGIYIGSNAGGSDFFTGLFREIKIWKRGFSAAETLALTQ